MNSNIRPDYFFSDTLNVIDQVIGNFVKTAYQNFIEQNTTTISLVFTFYIMLIGYRLLTHQYQEDFMIMVRRVIVMMVVYSLIMQWELYNIFVYNIFTNEPNHISEILAKSIGSLSGNSINTALDSIYALIINATNGFLQQVSLTSLQYIVYAALVYGIGTAFCTFALLLFIYAKMMMAVSLALGPVFILFVLFDATKDIFAAWIRKLITIALIPIVTSAILLLLLSVIEMTLPGIRVEASELNFNGIVPFLGLVLTTLWIISQVFNICSSLGGGISLASMSKAADLAKKSLQYSGMTQAGKQVLNWSKNQIKKRIGS